MFSNLDGVLNRSATLVRSTWGIEIGVLWFFDLASTSKSWIMTWILNNCLIPDTDQSMVPRCWCSITHRRHTYRHGKEISIIRNELKCYKKSIRHLAGVNS